MGYLLNSTICLGLFFAFYHFVLSHEKMHGFNRAYLLGSFLLSASIPMLTITVGEVLPETVNNGGVILQQILLAPENAIESVGFWQKYSLFFIIAYAIITSIFLFRFLKNLYGIREKIKVNPKLRYKNAQLVLLNKSILPYTFMHYIFLDKNAYAQGKIEDDLLSHELAHVQQKHSIDLFFMELVKVFFWFNPLVYIYQKAIQLNHEFLADDAVIHTTKNISQYQYLLLSKVSLKRSPVLTSHFNFSLTKKRFIMMTKKSSDLSILLKKITLIPLVLVFVLLFSQKTIAQNTGISSKEMKTYAKVMQKAYDEKLGSFIIRKEIVQKLNYLYENMSEAQRTEMKSKGLLIPPPPPAPLAPPAPSPKVYKNQTIPHGAPPPPPAPKPKKSHYIPRNPSQDIVTSKDEAMIRGSKASSYGVYEIFPPPAPMSPKEHIKKLVKEGANFYYDGKAISGKVALTILNTNPKVNITISEEENQVPVVKLFSKPIQLKKER